MSATDITHGADPTNTKAGAQTLETKGVGSQASSLSIVLNRLEAPALSCLMAVFCALAISELHSNNVVTIAALYLSFFFISSGLFFDFDDYGCFSKLAKYCLIPVVFFILVWNGKHLASLAWGLKDGESFAQKAAADLTLLKIIIITPVLGLFLWLGIVVSAIAMRRFRRFAVPVILNDGKELQTVSSNLAKVGAIGGALFTGLTWVVQRFD